MSNDLGVGAGGKVNYVFYIKLYFEKRCSAYSCRPVGKIMGSSRWTKEQLKLAFHLYCQLPFGRMHNRNPEIIKLAKLIDRTPSALAMKLVNFASLDPAITSSGRVGLGNAGSLDKEIWDEFHANWENLAIECEILMRKLNGSSPNDDDFDELVSSDDYSGQTKKAIVDQRIKQNFFRRAVLSSYQGRCCMSGLSEPRLLIASHIVPWSKNKANRLNPRNGLCLSAIHDKAFDKGLITLTDDLKIIISEELKRRKESFVVEVLLPLGGCTIEPPERFLPHPDFIKWHRRESFLDSRK
ncbi:MAG: HNH endonuclease [Burkholderiales bacterium]